MTTLQIRPMSIVSQLQRQPHRANEQTADHPEPVVVFVPDLWPDPKPSLRRLMASLNFPQRLSDWVNGLISGVASIR